ncbi:MAG: response regulator transcription factor [Thermoanaerobaculia bacterium]|nr:response regulator transcription factor [Thermoanaerobaculia bacterium]
MRTDTGSDPMNDTVPTILVVDDEPDARLLMRNALEAEGFEVWLAEDADEAEALIEERGLPHLAILDIVMPGRSGLELGESLLEFSDLPIVFLSAVDDEETIVEAIDQYAEDYVTKPFNPEELAVRTKRILRRVSDYGYALGRRVDLTETISVDFAQQRLKGGPEDVPLTPTETKILHILYSNAPQVVTTDYLLRRLWPEGDVFEDALRVHVHRLRQKLLSADEDTKDLIQTERGLGYRLEPKSERKLASNA